MSELLALLAKYGSLIVDVIGTLVRANSLKLTKEQIEAEVRRIKAKEARSNDAEWDIVKS